MDKPKEELNAGDALPLCSCSSLLERIKGEDNVCELHSEPKEELERPDNPQEDQVWFNPITEWEEVFLNGAWTVYAPPRTYQEYKHYMQQVRQDTLSSVMDKLEVMKYNDKTTFLLTEEAYYNQAIDDCIKTIKEVI